MMRANHRYTFTAIFLCTLINQSSQFKRCAEKATSNQTRNSSESCIVAGGNSLMVHYLQPLVKLSELDDSVCNRIRPLNVFLCEVYYQILPDGINYQLSWRVNINGTISEDLIFLNHDINGTGHFPKNETVSGFKLIASTLLERNKTHCTEPILISTLTVYPPTNNVTENFNVSCEIHHGSLVNSTNPINVTDSHRYHDLTAELPQNLQLQHQYCNNNNCTVTVTWSPPKNEDCIAFYDVIINLDNATAHSMSAFLLAKSRLDFKHTNNYSHTAVLPCGSYNATVSITAENICSLRSAAATLPVSEMMCATNVCSGTKLHDCHSIIDILLILVPCIITGLLLQ